MVSNFKKIKILLDLENYLETKELLFIVQIEGNPDSKDTDFYCPTCHERFEISLEVQKSKKLKHNEQKNVEPEIEIRKVNHRVGRCLNKNYTSKPNISIKCISQTKCSDSDQQIVFNKKEKTEKRLRLKKSLSKKSVDEEHQATGTKSKISLKTSKTGTEIVPDTDAEDSLDHPNLDGNEKPNHEIVELSSNDLGSSISNQTIPDTSKIVLPQTKQSGNEKPKSSKYTRQKFTCKHCSPPVTRCNGGSFREHLRRLHPEVAKRLKITCEPLLCSFCGLKSITYKQHHAHVQIHLHPEKFQCKVCQKVRYSNLVQI